MKRIIYGVLGAIGAGIISFVAINLAKAKIKAYLISVLTSWIPAELVGQIDLAGLSGQVYYFILWSTVISALGFGYSTVGTIVHTSEHNKMKARLCKVEFGSSEDKVKKCISEF